MHLIGDPHLGKEFRTGVALHRRGEREEQLVNRFCLELVAGGQDGFCVCVGDLFDSPNVDRAVVKDTIDFVAAVAKDFPSTFAFMAGNHDRSRQPGVTSAWDLFVRGVRHLPNVIIAETPMIVGDVLLLPWEWARSAKEQLEGLTLPANVKTAVCHHDLESFGGNDTHMLPARALRQLGIETIYGGHWHLAGDYEVDGITVHCTGSMLPLAHGEGDPYVTYDLTNLPDPTDLYDKVVRIRAKRGDLIPDIDALAVTVVWEDAEQHTSVADTAAQFDLGTSLHRLFAVNEVPDFAQTFIQERL